MADFRLEPAPWWVDPLLDYAHTGDFQIVGAALGPRNKGPFRFDGDVLSHMDTLVADHPDTTRRDVVTLVEQLAARGPTPRLKRDLDKAIGRLELGDVSLHFDPRRGVLDVAQAVLKPSSLKQWAAYTLASLIAGGYGDRLAKCELPSCGKTFVKWKRLDQAYCSPSHGSQVRQKRSREGRK